MYFDAHNHLQDEWLIPHQDALLQTLPALGIRGAVVNGTSARDWSDLERLCKRANWLIPSFGLHPWLVGNRKADWLPRLEACLLSHPNAGIGECGLDRWMLDRAKPDDPRLRGLRRAPLVEQREVFLSQLDLASRLERPCSIHCVDAWGLLLDTLSAHPRLPRGFLLHAYTGSAELIPAFAQLGARFSFNGAFLAPRRQNLREIFTVVPLDRLLAETDAPAMIPPPDHRVAELPGNLESAQINHPANLCACYQALATLRGMALPDLQEQLASNFKALFVG